MRLLTCFLLCCCTASAQSFFSFKDSSIVRSIDLPRTEPFDSSRAYYRVTIPYVYICSESDLYRLFGWPIPVTYREFDFANYHILGEQKCSKCMAVCHHDEGQRNCHRDRCNKEWIWVMRENKKAFTEVPVLTLPGHTGTDLSRHLLLRDTIIKAAADTGFARWYTTGHGDCHGHFKYGIYADKYHPVLLLKEWNYWGGCRAGGSWDYTLSFSMPTGILYKIKSITLVEYAGAR